LRVAALNSSTGAPSGEVHYRVPCKMLNPLFGGLIGALTTNVLHELVRRMTPEAPRVDLLGMQALAKAISVGADPPTGRALYAYTLAGDIASNTLYFATLSLLPRRYAPLAGLLVGALAGAGAVVLPKPLGLSETTTARTSTTKLLTVSLYAAGGLAAGVAMKCR
jgi:hypothetical protein